MRWSRKWKIYLVGGKMERLRQRKVLKDGTMVRKKRPRAANLRVETSG
jgi:hypothetical protein